MRLNIIILFAVFLPYGCQINEADPGSGCASDNDCRLERVCRDRLCLFPEEAEKYEPAQQLAETILRTLATNNLGAYSILWPTAEDYDWAFDLSVASGASEDSSLIIAQSELELMQSWQDLRDSRDWESAEFLDFEPGVSAPIAIGDNRTKRPLDRLTNSLVTYEKDGKVLSLTIDTLIRFRGRWRIFRLIPSTPNDPLNGTQ